MRTLGSSVQVLRQRRPFDGERLDAVPLERLEDAHELAGHAQVALRAETAQALELGHGLRRYAGGPRRCEPRGEQAEEPFVPGLLDEPRPVGNPRGGGGQRRRLGERPDEQ